MRQRFAAVLCSALLLCSGCTEAPESLQRTEELLGTYVSVTVYGSDAGTREAAVDAAFARAFALEQTFSPTLTDSELCAVNAAAHTDAVPVSEDFYALAQIADAFCERYSGALDCTIGGLIDLWGIGTANARVPSPAEIAAALPSGSTERLRLENGCVQLPEENAQLHFGAVAKGYIADEMQAVLRAYGITSAALSLGGNVQTIGSKPDGTAWNVGITNPFAPEEIIASVCVTDCSVVTSGTYERGFEENGVYYHHILDPETGYPADAGLASVTILSPSSVTCDALSTAVFVLGVQEGLALVEGTEGAEALLIAWDGTFHTTSGMAQYELTRTDGS